LHPRIDVVDLGFGPELCGGTLIGKMTMMLRANILAGFFALLAAFAGLSPRLGE
jgi:hypothetical protein